MALLNIIKILAILQIFILIFLIIASFFTKWRMEWMLPFKQKRRDQFKKALIDYPYISDDMLKELKKHLHMTFVVFLETENVLSQKQDILKDLFLEQVPQRATANIWYDRYMAAVLIQFIHRYGIDFPTEKLLISLLNDPMALVSLNALKAISILPNEKLIIEATSIFSKWRRSQLELMVSMLKDASFTFPKIIIQKLQTEPSPIIRSFYYRLLNDLPMIQEEMPYLLQDIHNFSLDLALSSLTYLISNKKLNYQKYLQEALTEERWQIRARALRYLGNTQDPKYIKLITPLLNDKIWWVRFRAAQALSHMGLKGQKALEKAKIGLNIDAKDISSLRLENMDMIKEKKHD